MADRREVVVTLQLTEAQAIALEDMLSTWNWLGGAGASRWTAFYADGDGNFKPHATIDGRKPEPTDLLTKDERWPQSGEHRGEYRIDFDTVAWRLRAKREKAAS